MNDHTASVRLSGDLAMCAGECSSGRAGHAARPIQEVVALASPTGWRDAILVAATSDGWIELADLDGETLRVWHHTVLGLTAGEPVALHRASGLLAVAGGHLNVVVER